MTPDEDSTCVLSNVSFTDLKTQSAYVTTLVTQLASEAAAKPIRVAAGLALKNAFSAREYTRLREVQEKWLQQVNADTKKGVKDITLQTLASENAQAGQAAAQVIASIA